MGIKTTVINELKQLAQFKATTRKWQFAFLSAITVGTPLLLSVYFDNLKYGLMACLSGLIILHLPASGSFTNRILTLLVCSFGVSVSALFGLLVSFNPWLATISFGLFSMTVHWLTLYYKAAPPRSFFFILVAAMSICRPFNLAMIPTNVGLLSLGSMFTCALAIIYIFVLSREAKTKPTTETNKPITPIFAENAYADIWESFIFGGFMLASLATGYLLEFNNPYWIPISCAAVMQGASLYHVHQRVFHRILGTFIGLGVTWGVIKLVHQDPWLICIAIVVLFLCMELIITKHYAFAVVFITPFSILLNEAGNPIFSSPNELIVLRFQEIIIGSILGALGGWFLYKEKLRYATINKLKKLVKS